MGRTMGYWNTHFLRLENLIGIRDEINGIEFIPQSHLDFFRWIISEKHPHDKIAFYISIQNDREFVYRMT
jgi:hypothetical protein